MLTWIFDPQYYHFHLKTPLNPKIFHVSDSHILHFATQYSYFSDDHPLIAKVTNDPADLNLTQELLKEIHHSIKEDKQRTLMTDEVLAKILAYRELKKGQEILIPSQNNQLLTFEVDELFDLGKGMPAFGLISKNKGEAPSFLIFRGTEMSILSRRGLASIISDLDPKGAGLSLFLKSQPAIHTWLKKTVTLHPKIKIIGFSLGGSLALYTYLYEYALIKNNSFESCTIFNPPGVSEKIFDLWKSLSRNHQMKVKVFVTKGDLIPKIALLLGDIYQLSIDSSLLPIAAHTLLISAQPTYYQNVVDIELENHSNRFFR